MTIQGRLKNEMFYGRSWIGVTMDDFINELNSYIDWYNTKRIKMHSIKKHNGLLRADNCSSGRQSPDGDAEYDIKYRKKSQFIFK